MLLAVAVIITIVFYSRMRTGQSAEALTAEAEEAYESGDYETVLEAYEQIVASDEELEPEKLENITIKYADSLIKTGDSEKALVVLSTFLNDNPGNEAALTALIEIYAERSDSDKINETLSTISDDSVREKFSGYLALPPVFETPPGEYSEEFKLKITSEQLGNIYYTTDGSEPTVNSNAYSGEIDIKEGDTVVKAIFVNTYDLVSDTAAAEYKVDFETPETPVVVPASGVFDQPDYINLIVPQGVSAYYTTDGSEPDENSQPYEKQLTMKLGKSTYKFIFISDKGVKSPVTEVNYELNLSAAYSTTDAINYVTASLVASRHMADIFGNPLPGTPESGKGRYVFKCDYAAREGNRTYYLVDEYLEDSSGNLTSTGDVYAVDSIGGMLYRAKQDNEGKWSFTLFY